MRTRIVLLAVVGSVMLPVWSWGHGGPELNVTGPVRLGGPIRIAAEDLTPNGVQTILLRRSGMAALELGRVPTDADGGFMATLHVPDSLSPGFYQVSAEGKVSATTQVEVIAMADQPAAGRAAPAEPPGPAASFRRPAGETAGLSVAISLIAALGAGLLWFSRSRAQRP